MAMCISGPQNKRMRKDEVMAGVDERIVAKSKVVGHNTVRYWTHPTLLHGPEEVLRYTKTDIVRITDHGVILNSGGWRTMTTKEKIDNELRRLGINLNLWSDRGTWCIGGNYLNTDQEAMQFFDGIKVAQSTGRILNPKAGKKEIDREKMVMMVTDRYIKRLCKVLKKRGTGIGRKASIKVEPMEVSHDERTVLESTRMFKTLTLPYIPGALLVQALQSHGWTAKRIEVMYFVECPDEHLYCHRNNPRLSDYMLSLLCRATKRLILKKFGLNV